MVRSLNVGSMRCRRNHSASTETNSISLSPSRTCGTKKTRRFPFHVCQVFLRLFFFRYFLYLFRSLFFKSFWVDFGSLFGVMLDNCGVLCSIKNLSDFWSDFSSIFVSKSLCRKSADIDFVLVFAILFACRPFFCESLFACIFGPNNVPKTFPKRRPTLLKIDAENVLFCNIDFFSFRPRFRSLLDLQDGAKLA